MTDNIFMMSHVSHAENEEFSNDIANCKVCLDLNANYLRRQRRKFRGYSTNAPHNATPENLETSGVFGCRGCQLLNDAVKTIEQRFDFRFPRVELEYLDDDHLRGLSVQLRKLYDRSSREDEWERARRTDGIVVKLHVGETLEDPNAILWISTPQYEVFVPEQLPVHASFPPPEWTAIDRRPLRSEDTASDKAVKWVLGHLNRCHSNHPRCERPDSRWTLPSRVVDLGPIENTKRDTIPEVRLYETEGEQADYVCLSHCWGKSSVGPLQTKWNNIQAFRESIPFEMLPPVFQQAAIFTKNLGIRYIWIDSLCIIQDSEKDWSRESGKMSTIYRDAALTIAAASSSDSHGSLFSSLTTTMELPQAPVCMREFPDVDFFNYQMIGDTLGHKVSPLMERAWVFQERLLSRRVLFFTPLELVWECETLADSESGHWWINHVVKQQLGGADQQEGELGLPDRWQKLVREYTCLRLTYQKDKLPAIAGLARRLAPLLASDYLAGLWRKTFISDLLWTQYDRLHKREYAHLEESSPGIPSWSWAVTASPIEFVDGELLGTLCKVIEVSCTSNDGDTFVQVHSGHMIISGYLIGLTTPDFLGNVSVSVDGHGNVAHNAHPDYSWESPGPRHISKGSKLYALPIALSPDYFQLRHNFQVHCLVLRLVTQVVRQTTVGRADGLSTEDSETPHSDIPIFERVGLFRMNILGIYPYQYILEDEGFLLQALTKQVEYGRGKLMGNGSYASLSHHDYDNTSYSNVAFEAFLNVPEKERDGKIFEEWYGAPHLREMERQLEAERNRIDEWLRGDESKEAQLHCRTTLKIV